MSESTVNATAPTPAVEPPCKRKMGILFISLIFIILLAGLGMGYYQLGEINITLAKRVHTLQQLLDNQGRFLLEIKSQLNGLPQNNSLATPQTKPINDWQAVQQGDINKWNVTEAQYLTKLANDHLQYTHETALAAILLQRAQEILSPIQDTAAIEIRKSLMTDIAAIQSAPSVNVTDLYVKLSAIDAQLDKLPLPSKPLQANPKQEELIIPADWPWWKAGLAHTWQALRKVIVIHRQEDNDQPLIFPEQKMYLLDNLHAQMSQVIWAVLHRDATVYQQGLARVMGWIQQYFVKDAPETMVMLQQLTELQKINLQPPTTNIVATLHLFDNYLAQGNKPQSAE